MQPTSLGAFGKMMGKTCRIDPFTGKTYRAESTRSSGNLVFGDVFRDGHDGILHMLACWPHEAERRASCYCSMVNTATSALLVRT